MTPAQELEQVMSRKNRDRNEQRAARRLQAATGIPYQTALQRVRERRALRGLPLTLARIIRRRIRASQLQVSDANALAIKIATHVVARHSQWTDRPHRSGELPVDSEYIFASDLAGIVCGGLEYADRRTSQERMRLPDEFWDHVADVATNVLADIVPHVLPQLPEGFIDFRSEVENCLFPDYDIDDSLYIDKDFHG